MTKIRRSQFEGISVQVTRCQHTISVEAKINEVQVSLVSVYSSITNY